MDPFSRYSGYVGYGANPFCRYIPSPGFMDSSLLFSQQIRNGPGAGEPIGSHNPFSQYNPGGRPFGGSHGSLGMGYHIGEDSLRDRWGLRATRGPLWW
jgi:hypothetical protein